MLSFIFFFKHSTQRVISVVSLDRRTGDRELGFLRYISGKHKPVIVRVYTSIFSVLQYPVNTQKPLFKHSILIKTFCYTRCFSIGSLPGDL